MEDRDWAVVEHAKQANLCAQQTVLEIQRAWQHEPCHRCRSQRPHRTGLAYFLSAVERKPFYYEDLVGVLIEMHTAVWPSYEATSLGVKIVYSGLCNLTAAADPTRLPRASSLPAGAKTSFVSSGLA